MNAVSSPPGPPPDFFSNSEDDPAPRSFIISVDPCACTGCMRCRLACSDLFTKSFNPSRARIHIMLNDSKATIRFDDECTGCGICVEHCFFGALRKREKEAA